MTSKYKPQERNQRIKHFICNLKHKVSLCQEIVDSKTNAVTERLLLPVNKRAMPLNKSFRAFAALCCLGLSTLASLLPCLSQCMASCVILCGKASRVSMSKRPQEFSG